MTDRYTKHCRNLEKAELFIGDCYDKCSDMSRQVVNDVCDTLGQFVFDLFGDVDKAEQFRQDAAYSLTRSSDISNGRGISVCYLRFRLSQIYPYPAGRGKSREEMDAKVKHDLFTDAARKFPLECQDCGCTGAKPGICPWDDDAEGIMTPVILCGVCHSERFNLTLP